VEFAKQHALPVIAANAPADIVRCVGRQGAAYLEKLSVEERSSIAIEPFGKVEGYDEKFFGFMQGEKKQPPSKRLQHSYMAQLLRDNTMAESILSAYRAKMEEGMKPQVLHVNGTFHSADRLGTVGALSRLDPSLKISVLTPVHIDRFDPDDQVIPLKDDFYYLIAPQPAEFVDSDYKNQIRSQIFADAAEKAKACR